MLSHHLNGALKDLRELIEITQADVNDIKEAKNESQFSRLPLKEEKIASFENKKAMIDYEISLLISSNPNQELSSLITQEQHKLLDDLKVELSNLHEINKRYAKLVLAVSNLYNSFLEKVVPTEMQGYKKVASQVPSFLEVRA